MEKSDNLIKKLLVLISVLLAVFLVVELVSLSILNSLRSGSNLKGELATISPASSTYPTTSSTYLPTCPASAKYVLPATNEYKIFIPGIYDSSQTGDCSDLVSSLRSLISGGDFYSWDCQDLGCNWFVDSNAASGYEETCGGDGTYSCGGATNQEICEALPECKWDSETQACGQVKEFCNISYTKQVCSVCTEQTEGKDCGTGKKCCIQGGGTGVCYDPASQVCCGPKKCGEKLPRASSGGSGFCVDNSGVCYKAGANTKCMSNSEQLPVGWIKDVGDSYRYIAGNLALKIYNTGKPLFKNAVLKGTLDLPNSGRCCPITRYSIYKTGDCTLLGGGSVICSLTGTVSGIDVIFNFGELYYQTKFKYEKITGYKKVDNNKGRGEGGGRGEGNPTDEAIKKAFKGTVIERTETIGLAIPIFLNGGEGRWSNWWVAPTVMTTDFKKVFGGVQVGKGNFKIQFLTGGPVGTTVTVSWVWGVGN